MLDALTDDEIALIRERRAKKAQREAVRAFQHKAIATAHAFADWSEASGEGLTFSTFINTFGYQEADGQRMYDAVNRGLKKAKGEILAYINCDEQYLPGALGEAAET